jgi:alpha-D-ribose 1-methylphosphonate 5-triphosphate synthase subunit PhnG
MGEQSYSPLLAGEGLGERFFVGERSITSASVLLHSIPGLTGDKIQSGHYW